MDSWDAIRSLDEEENWTERNRVVSKKDHLLLKDCAKDIVEEIVENLPVPVSPDAPLPSHNPAIENDYINQFTDDDFKYSATRFDIDYLENLSSAANPDPSDLARKSLFVKFDPLVNKLSPRGREPSRNEHQLVNVPTSEGDLLLLNTTPQPVHKKDTNSILLSSQSSLLSPINNNTITTATPPVRHSAAFIPESDNLVNVLKYSEDDLPEILEGARKLQRDTETAKYEEQIRLLHEKLARTRQQLQQNNRRKENFQTKAALQDSAHDKAEQDVNNYREKLNSHVKRERELQIKHEEFKKDVAELDEQMELITRDSTNLENSFDELHQIYVKLKTIHQCLTERNRTVQRCIIEWKGWHQQDTENTEKIEREILSLQQRVEEIFENMEREHASKMTVERAKALKLKIQEENLVKSYKQKEEEKQQVSLICDELMRELETVR